MLGLFDDVPTVTLAPDKQHFFIQTETKEHAEEFKEKCKGIRWDKRNRRWVVGTHVDQVAGLLNLGLAWEPDATKYALCARDRAQLADELSRATDAELDLPGFQVSPFPFQRAGIKYGIERQRAIIGDEMGLGKTIQGMGIIYGANAFPALIVTPASLKYNWAEKEIPRAMPNHRVVLADKDTGEILLRMADVIVTNYEQLVGFRTYKSHKKEIDPVTREERIVTTNKRTSWANQEKKEVVLSPLGEKLLNINLVSVVADEAHYLKDGATARTCAFAEVIRSAIYKILLTGTPMLNKPSELASLLKLIDRLDEFGGWWHFMTHYCGMRNGDYGLVADEAFDTLNLNTKMRQICYVRRQKSEVLKDLPPKTRSLELLEIDNREEYEKAERELLSWVRDRVLQDQAFLDSIKHLPRDRQNFLIKERQDEKEEKAAKAEEMVRIQALKNVTARGKLAAAFDWVDTFLESGEKLVLFATQIEIQKKLLARYKQAARIVSDDDAQERQRNVEKFQSDSKCNIIICAQGTSATNSPGGVGHTLTKASNVAFLELGWNPALHDQCEDRCHRIGQQDNVTAHYLLGRNTIDLDIAELIEEKRAVVAQVVDGIDQPETGGILDDLMERLATKAAE